MTYEEFASDLPRHRMVFSSAEETEETMRCMGVRQEMRQLGRGAYRSEMAVRTSEDADFYADRFNKACSIFLEAPADTVGLLIFRSANGPLLASGNNVANDKLVVMPSGSGVDLVIPDLAGSEAFTVPEARFIAAAEALCPTPKSVRPDRLAMIEGDTVQLQALRKAMIDLVARPESDPDPDPEGVSNLIAKTIAWMGHSSSKRSPEAMIVNGARKRIAKLVQELVEEHYRDPVHLEELCRATGVGVRTLQRCFREFFDLTITDYLKAVRLDKARRELIAADPLHDSVGRIALEHGCTHLGRFSVTYRERFAESPRQTLAGRGPSRPGTIPWRDA